MSKKSAINALLATSVCMGLNSCWFNTAGYIFDKAHYQASSDVKDIKPGDSVYENNGKYYIKLPRFKTGKGPQIMYPNDTNKERHVADGEQVFQIPSEYANYLSGGYGANMPEYLKPVDDQAIVSPDKTTTVTQSPEAHATSYKYTSPNAVWLDTAGVFEVMCVDLPISITLTSLTMAGAFVMTMGQQQIDDMRTLKAAPPCERCGGKGGWTYERKVDVYNGLGTYQRSYMQSEYEQCSECAGTGKQGGAELKMRGELRKGLIRAAFQR